MSIAYDSYVRLLSESLLRMKGQNPMFIVVSTVIGVVLLQIFWMSSRYLLQSTWNLITFSLRVLFYILVMACLLYVYYNFAELIPRVL